MSFSIVTDTVANLTPELIRKHELTVIPFLCCAGEDKSFCPDIDSFDDVAYYDAMKGGMTVTTSQINPQQYINYIEPLLKEGKDVLFVGLSSGVSGSFASSLIAQRTLSERYPERKIEMVDSLGASLGEGLLVLRAVECRKNGMTIDETAERLKVLRHRVAQIFFVDDLMFLKRTGRLSGGTAIIGTMLGIKPILKGDKDGKIVTAEKVRGRRQAIMKLAEKYCSLAKNAVGQLIGISYCGCKKDAEYLCELIRSKVLPQDVLIVKHEPATGSHLGPGSLALYFEGGDAVRLY